MKKKNRLLTNTLRTIKKTFPRFLSLIIMSLLGVLVFVGLTATSPDMVATIDKYFDKYNTYDINVVSSMGLTDKDISSLQKITNIQDIEGSYSEDVLVKKDDVEYVLKVSSLPTKINTLHIITGRLPENDNEIVVEENFLTNLDYKLNDKITLNSDNFIEKEVTIVGTVSSSLYFNNVEVNQNRGSTTIGTGTINYYSYVKPSNFNTDYYTNIYLTVKKAKEETTSSSSYLSLIEDLTNELNKIKDTEENRRYQDLYTEAEDEINKNEAQANQEFADAKKELDKAKKELSEGKKELDQVAKTLSSTKKQLNAAKKEITNGKQELEDTLKEYNITNLNTSLSKVNNNISNIEKILSTLDPSSSEYQTNSATLVSLKQQRTLINTLINTEEQLNQAEKTYNSNYSKYQKANRKYQSGLKEYNTNLAKYNDSLEEYNDSKREVEDELKEARQQLADISKPTWYIYDRSDDQTYSSYIDQTKSISNLSALFPLVFYAVAILVSLISMNRMVEDDRGEIGTFKSLGFTNREIRNKYLIFSLSATLIGGLIGIIIGLTLIPYLIFSIYRILFSIPDFQFTLNLPSTLGGLFIAILCICGSSIITSNRILKDKPASLMRPKAPKNGKKILLEKIKPLWHHLKFSNKITIRNIFRYKKRVLVTIIGISGCTALMLCGFGIKDCIVDITNMQYGQTFKYDVTIYTNNLKLSEVQDITNNPQIKDYTLAEVITGNVGESNINMLITENQDQLSKIVNLYNEDNKKITLQKNEVIITDKLADNHNLTIGDQITVLDSDKKEYQFIISGIVKNYLGHYIYMNKETFENINEQYQPNIIYLNTPELSTTEKDELSNELLAKDSVINVVHTSTLKDSVKDMLDSLNKVIVILVLLSALLSFVVLYNLSNINISERNREIATLKVLGFYDSEVDHYITKETIILTIIGITIGLGLGIVLTNLTIGTVEMENYRFLRRINPLSFLYASIISSLFTIIVNYVTHFTLKKINMIESLKSIE
ncbi:MAG TPA: FtsX-like permease family protein [Candidatus Coprovivens excrementavium]|nr:FtsX-like permease family protein [Candidatus Coprovivens excrementavium]